MRAHVAAKKHNLKLIVGSEIRSDDGLKLVLLAPDRRAYGALCSLITVGRQRAEKGAYSLGRQDLDAASQGGLLALWVPGENPQETDARWLEREPGIWERADWDLGLQRLTLSVRGDSGESTMTLWWLAPERWNALLSEAGFIVEACYDWFDRRPYAGGEDSIWIARRT